MSATTLQHMKGDAMEHIDVHDLPEDQAQFVAAFVEFLRTWQRQHQDTTAEERDWQRASIASFVKDWDNDENAIYDDWRKHYHVREG
jgi:hypothetical protein